MKKGLAKMREYLPGRGDDKDRNPSPIVRTYLTTVLLPTLGRSMGARNEAELRLLAEALDSLLAGEVALTGDLLMQQFKAVEMAQLENGWSLAKHMQPIPAGKVSAVPEEERTQVMKVEERELRMKALEAKLSWGRGRS